MSAQTTKRTKRSRSETLYFKQTCESARSFLNLKFWEVALSGVPDPARAQTGKAVRPLLKRVASDSVRSVLTHQSGVTQSARSRNEHASQGNAVCIPRQPELYGVIEDLLAEVRIAV